MSASVTPEPAGLKAADAKDADQAVMLAKSASEAINAFKTADPALYNQMVGSLSTYGSSAAAPAIGAGIGFLVMHYGLGTWITPDMVQLATLTCCAIGSMAGAALQHWMSKSPTRKIINGVPSGPTT